METQNNSKEDEEEENDDTKKNISADDDGDGSLLLPEDFSKPSKARTLFLMRLNMAAYPLCTEKLQHGHQCSFSEDTLRQVLQNGQSLYGPNITTYEGEVAATQAFESRNWDLLLSPNNSNNSDDNGKTGNVISFRKRSIPKETAEFDIGLSAMVWELDNDNHLDRNTTILVFRGTFTHGDYANIEHWMMNYALEKSTDRMKEAWIKDAGLNWTTEMQDRSDHHDDTWEKLGLRAHQLWNEEAFPNELLDSILSASKDNDDASSSSSWKAAESPPGSRGDGDQDDDDDEDNGTSSGFLTMTLREARETGYWELTKHIVDQVVAETVAKNRTLILTGHSQGGTRAQLASMYIQKEHGLEISTVSFAATGAACMARLLFGNGGASANNNLLQDVDPFSRHDQIIEYVHPLDPWGNSMLGEDNGGMICHIGGRSAKVAAAYPNNKSNNTTSTTNDDERARMMNDTSPAKDYCSQIYGWPGPILIANEHISRPVANLELKRNFQRCRYFTHNTVAIFLALSDSLLEDGSTAAATAGTWGGCVDALIIPRDDPNGVCPTGQMTIREDETFGLLVVVIGVILLMLSRLCYNMMVCPKGMATRLTRRRTRAGYRAADHDAFANSPNHLHQISDDDGAVNISNADDFHYDDDDPSSPNNIDDAGTIIELPRLT